MNTHTYSGPIPHPNPRIETMSETAYLIWHRNLSAKPWPLAGEMVRRKFYTMVQGMLDAAFVAKEAA